MKLMIQALAIVQKEGKRLCRLGNRVMHKQLLFDTRTQDKAWKQMKKCLGVNRAQVRGAQI